MPNGEGKNWIRLSAAVDGCRARFGEWPTMIKIPVIIIEDLEDYLQDETWKIVKKRLRIVPDDVGFIVEDDQGQQYDYAQEGFFEISPNISARTWF